MTRLDFVLFEEGDALYSAGQVTFSRCLVIIAHALRNEMFS